MVKLLQNMINTIITVINTIFITKKYILNLVKIWLFQPSKLKDVQKAVIYQFILFVSFMKIFVHIHTVS